MNKQQTIVVVILAIILFIVGGIVFLQRVPSSESDQFASDAPSLAQTSGQGLDEYTKTTPPHIKAARLLDI